MKRTALILLALSLLLWPAMCFTADPPPKPAVVAPALTADDARAALARDQQQRQADCGKAIQAACEKYRFSLQARPGIVDGRIVADVVLVPVQ